MALLKGIGRAIGRGGARAGRAGMGMAGSRFGMTALGVGGFGIGMMNKVGPAARDAAFDVAFDDPNADVAFTGRKFDARFLAGTAMGGPVGGLLTNPLISPSDAYAASGINPVAISTAIGVGGGLAIAGAGVLKGGFKMGPGALLRGGSAFRAARKAGAGGAGKAMMGAMGSGVVGGAKSLRRGLVGGGIFAAASIGAGALGARSYMNNNEQFFNESPYAGRTSASVASALNASGDIVLGMHNSRRP